MSGSIEDALSFFRLSCGLWRSRRSSHHLLHRRAEAGGSTIEVVELGRDDPRLVAIAALHGQEAGDVAGGCRVRWSGSMAWDRAGENHEGESVFALIPSDGAGREGLLLRDRGYAETAPVAGRFRMEPDDSLLLTTSYETMTSIERFSFAGPDLRLRTSAVEGLSNTASFCLEVRLAEPTAEAEPPQTGSDGGSGTALETPLSPLGW